MSEAIFISYRRGDAAGHAAWLKRYLVDYFDTDQIFFDVGSIESSADFRARIEPALTHARVVLVVIGPDWLDEIRKRAFKAPLDWVRREIALSLARRQEPDGPLVVPLLVGGVDAPDEATLPWDVKGLAALQMHRLDNEPQYESDFQRLLTRLTGLPGVPQPRFRVRDARSLDVAMGRGQQE